MHCFRKRKTFQNSLKYLCIFILNEYEYEFDDKNPDSGITNQDIEMNIRKVVVI